MKAMVLHETAEIERRPLRLQDVPTPRPGPGQVRVKVCACGVCRTDLHVIEGDLPEAKRPVIPGHQVVGRVDAVGAGCERLREGQRVGIAWLRWTCGDCPHCRADRENLCQQQRFTGYHADGGYAEYAVIDEDFAYEVPDAFDDVEATPLLCAGIVGYRALKRARVPEGGSLAIYGFGSSAHVIAPIARYRGARLFVVTRSEGHQQLAREMGAEWVGDDPAEMPEKVDSAVLFAPTGKLVPPTLSIGGIYLSPVPSLDYKKHLFYERDLRTVTANTRDDGRELLAAAAEVGLRPRTTTYALTDANRALKDVKDSKIDGTGVLVPED
jgi:propanol-preferring alcohol dehydrogenase